MKLQIVKFITALLMMLSLGSNKMVAQEVDAMLALTIARQTTVIAKELGLINASQASIMAENIAIMATLDDIKDYEETMLNYLCNSNKFFQSAQQVVTAIEKVSGIVSELNQCRIAAKDNPEGVVATALVNKQYNKTLLEASGLVANVTTLVKSGGKNNLLNSAERLQILYNINAQLDKIYSGVKDLRFNIICMKLSYVAQDVSPELYNIFYNKEELAYKSALGAITRMENAFK